MDIIKQDAIRYGKYKMPKFQYFYRKVQSAKNPLSRSLYNVFFKLFKNRNMVELPKETKIGPGLYIGHPYAITINREAVLGKNINISKGATIGQENRGDRKGSPVIGDDVWIGVNATIVGKIKIGNDVMIAPNTFVNIDVPSHSIAIGNPCRIKEKENATDGYIDNRVE